jgi:hypothetical protein
VGREARPGRTLRTIPQTVSAFVRPLGVLIGMPGTDSTFSVSFRQACVNP